MATCRSTHLQSPPCCAVLCCAVRNPLWRDLEIIEDPTATPRQKIAARLTKIEKSILQGCLDAVTTCAPCLGECWGMAAHLYKGAPVGHVHNGLDCCSMKPYSTA